MMNPSRLVVLTFLVVASLLSGCHKDTASPEYVGNWTWQQSTGGIAGKTYKPQPGEQVLLRLNEVGKLTITRSDTVFFSSDYTVQKAAKNDEYVLVISNKKSYTGSYQKYVPILYGSQGMVFQTDKLTLYDIKITDGYSHSFVR
ncbi:hypothetical protein [Spirosoma gilvum]